MGSALGALWSMARNFLFDDVVFWSLDTIYQNCCAGCWGSTSSESNFIFPAPIDAAIELILGALVGDTAAAIGK